MHLAKQGLKKRVMKYIGLILTILICTIGHAEQTNDGAILVANVPLPRCMGRTFTNGISFAVGGNMTKRIKASPH
jgi:hypothetical protein